MTTLRNSW